jgi:Rrf2 family protein
MLEGVFMNLSNTSQYAIRILAYITDHAEQKLLNATQLSQELQIPYKFLTKIMTELVKAELVESIRGREGGFKLKRSAKDITIDEILNLFHDSVKDEECLLGIGYCNKMCKCALHDQWMEPKLLMQKMFRESSLQDIAGQGCKI